MRITATLISVTALALAGCSQSDTTADTTQDGADAVESATNVGEPAADAGGAETKEAAADPAKPADDAEDAGDKGMAVTITGFECGDNCYLDYRPLDAADDADTQSALCSVGACEGWFSMQEMPAEYIGRDATIVLGTGKQYDNAGNVMSDDFAEVTAITIDPAE